MKEQNIWSFMEDKRLPEEKCIDLSDVYIVYNHNTGLCKIGKTHDMHQRFRQLKTGSGCNLEILLHITGLDPFYGEDGKNI
jgi:hypothetical protein